MQRFGSYDLVYLKKRPVRFLILVIKSTLQIYRVSKYNFQMKHKLIDFVFCIFFPQYVSPTLR